MDIVKKLEILAETTADDFPSSSIEQWAGEAAVAIRKQRVYRGIAEAGIGIIALHLKEGDYRAASKEMDLMLNQLDNL